MTSAISFVPSKSKKLIDPRPNRSAALHSVNAFVDRNGLCYGAHWSGAGLFIVEYGG